MSERLEFPLGSRQQLVLFAAGGLIRPGNPDVASRRNLKTGCFGGDPDALQSGLVFRDGTEN